MAGAGQPKTGGRKKGTRNKMTNELKGMILQALDESGGVEYLVKCAAENPTAYLTLLGKVLPMTVAGDPDNPLRFELPRNIGLVGKP